MCWQGRAGHTRREDGDLTSDLLGHRACLLEPSFSAPAGVPLFGFDSWVCLSHGAEREKLEPQSLWLPHSRCVYMVCVKELRAMLGCTIREINIQCHKNISNHFLSSHFLPISLRVGTYGESSRSLHWDGGWMGSGWDQK